MKEILLRVKRGQSQYYIEIVKQYKDIVYQSALINNSAEKAEYITVSVFLKLYDKIKNYFSIFNAEKHINKNIEKLAKKYDVEIVDTASEEQAPDIVLRKVLIELSTKRKSRRKRTFAIAIPVLTIVIAIAVTYVVQVSSTVISYEYESIQAASSEINLVYQRDTRMPVNLPGFPHSRDVETILDIQSIRNNIVLVKFINDYGSEHLLDKPKLIYEVFDGRNMLFRFFSDKNFYVVTANDNNTFIALSGNGLYMLDFEGEIVDFLNLGSFRIFSPDKNYLVTIKDNNYIIINLEEFMIVEETESEIYCINNYGEYLLKAEIISKWLIDEIFDRDRMISYSIYDNELFIIYDDGSLISLDKNGDTKEYSLSYINQHFEKLDASNVYKHVTQNHIIVAFEFEEMSGFELLCRKTGDSLVDPRDTLATGLLDPKPTLSTCKDFYIFSSQITQFRLSRRHNVVYDLRASPIKSYVLPNTYHIDEIVSGHEEEIMHIYTRSRFGQFIIYEFLLED